MPETKYMVNDPRRDHSIRIPRPDISLKTGSPNACNQCHKEETVKWADNAFRKWYGNKYDTIQHYGEVFYAASQGDVESIDWLKDIINDTIHTDIVKASALYYLGNYFPNAESLQEIIKQTNASSDELPLVKTTSLMQLANYNMQDYFTSVVPHLNDSLRTVRMEAARLIANVPPNYYPQNQKELIEKTVQEYIKSVLVNGDQPGANINLGVLYASHNQLADAERYYKNAIRISKSSIAAYINLADLYRSQNREAEAESIMLQALKINPEFPETNYSLGLLYARNQQLDKALKYLKKASNLEPDNSRFLYVYAIALNTSGENQEALGMLLEAAQQFPGDIEILFAISTISRDLGKNQQAINYAQKILDLEPQNQQAISLLNSLKENK
jgi:tetratricopeptide (TPR) repeat protein